MIKLKELENGPCGAETWTSEEGALVRWCSCLEGTGETTSLVS